MSVQVRRWCTAGPVVSILLAAVVSTGARSPRHAPATSATSATLVPAAAVAARAIGLVDGARRSVRLELYELGNPAVLAALVAAHRRGVAVQVVLDPTERQSRAAATALRRAGVAVRALRVPGGIDHVKLLVVDGASVLIGGVNLGMSSSYTSDLDVELHGAAAGPALRVFASDWSAAGGKGRPASGSYGPFITGGAIQASMLALLGGAPGLGSCTVLANYLTDWTVRDALVAAERRGVRVTVDLNATAYGAAEAARVLRAGGVRVDAAPPEPYLHAKVLACGTAAIVGSANLSYHGLAVNHELDVRLAGPAAAAVTAAAARIADRGRAMS